jgi:hypothetical protein
MQIDAYYLVELEKVEADVRKEEEQDNLIRRVAKQIAGNKMALIELQDVSKYCKTARCHIRRLRSLGFKVTKVKLSRQEFVGEKWYVSEWLVTLP